jgi:hypothetical protein
VKEGSLRKGLFWETLNWRVFYVTNGNRNGIWSTKGIPAYLFRITGSFIVWIFSIYYQLKSHRHRPKGNEMNTILIVRVTFFLATWVVMVLTTPLAYACTAFMMTDGKNVLVGNNEDSKIPYTRVWFIPAEKGRFGRVYFGYDNWSPQGGMNDQGLFFDYFSVKKLEIKQSREKPQFPGPPTDTMMAKCATVEDVLQLFSKYYLEWNPKIQMFVVDRKGDSAILEGETVVRNRASYQVVTNFRLSKVPEDERPCGWEAWSCSQYKKAEKMLLETHTPTVAHFRAILKATHRSSYNVIGTTQYSNIYDLTNRLVHVYYLHDFDKEINLNLSEELKKGPHYFDLPSLFGKELKYDNQVYTHSLPDFSISYPKHYEVIKGTSNEVLLVKNPLSSTPRLGVYVENKPKEIHLEDIGQEYFYSKIEKYSTSVKLVYSKQTLLNDGTPGVEILFDNVVNEYWPLKTLILSTYRGDKLIYAAITSFEHPEALRDCLYSLRFD